MRDFLKYLFATIVGIFVTGILSVVALLCFIGTALTTETKPIKDNSVLVININGTISERAIENPFNSILGNSLVKESGLDEILTAIKAAKEDERIKGIYLKGGILTDASPATLQEIRSALTDFKESKKFIISYADTYSQGSYYVCSVANQILINHLGMIDWKGMAVSTTYYKNLLDKLGIKMQVMKVGTYKSAVEPFLRDNMSDANREQISVFSEEIWNQILKDVALSRNLKVEKLNELADSAMLFADTKTYLKEKLVHKLLYEDEAKQIVADCAGAENAKKLNEVSVKDLSAAYQENITDTNDKIAVYTAFGNIVQESYSSFATSEIVGKKVAEDLIKLSDDKDIKAVVLRVNSGGGSAYASEQIWHAVNVLKSKKPVVVSMGGMAASGGYYISCGANWIVAEPTTITGSIGIFGMFPEASELLTEKIGLNFETVKTNKYSDIGDIYRPLTTDEISVLQGYINRGYELFVKRCADGRKMKTDEIKAIAEGRVWTGEHAKKIGLVDQLGTLYDAIQKAEELAGVENVNIVGYPEKPDMLNELLSEVSGSSYEEMKIKNALGDYYSIFTQLRKITNRSGIEASLPYIIDFNL